MFQPLRVLPCQPFKEGMAITVKDSDLTEAARIRSKSNRYLFVRNRKDSQQKQLLVVRKAITAKESRQKPQGFAAKAIVTCSSGDHRKRVTTEAARIRSKSNH